MLFNRGAFAYDTLLLKKAFNAGSSTAGTTDHLFKAKCLWRIQVVKYILTDKKSMVENGKRSLALLDSALQRGADTFAVTAIRAFVSQILAGTGLANGALYGPLTGGYLGTLKKVRPAAFETRLLEAFNFLEAPAFVGGSPQKAADAFEKLHKEFPDSVIVTVNLARALVKLDRKKEADALCNGILKKVPDDLWAKTVRAEISKK